MKKAIGFLFAAFGILLFATLMLVVIPSVQLSQVPPEPGLAPYSTIEAEGRRAYTSLGCVYCHSQQPRDASQAPDTERGWGRASTPGDYAYDYPHLLGTMRTGPDLFNIGVRQPSADWHLAHLYQPRALVPWSIMPSFPFLFSLKKSALAGDRVVKLPAQFVPSGMVVVASPEALALVAYLQALKRNYPSTELPFKGPRRPEQVDQ